jgi:hypothetical protein
VVGLRRIRSVIPRHRWRAWVVMAAAVVGWIAWEAFAAGGLFNDASPGGSPGRGAALTLVVTVVALLPASLSAWAEIRKAHRESATATSASTVASNMVPSRAKVDVLHGLPRLGDDPALAVEKLRVHRCIPLPADAPPGLDPDLPTWIERTKAPDVRAWMATASRHGALLVVVGESSVGKTRLLYEAAAAELVGWPVLAPSLGDAS